MEEVLHPSKIGTVSRRNSEFPSHVILEELCSPVAIIERRIREDKISPQILVLVIQKAALTIPLDQVRFYSSDGQVHLAQAPRCLVAFLAIDRDVADFSTVGFDELLALNKHST